MHFRKRPGHLARSSWSFRGVLTAKSAAGCGAAEPFWPLLNNLGSWGSLWWGQALPGHSCPPSHSGLPEFAHSCWDYSAHPLVFWERSTARLTVAEILKLKVRHPQLSRGQGTSVSALTTSCNDCHMQGGLTRRWESEAEASSELRVLQPRPWNPEGLSLGTRSLLSSYGQDSLWRKETTSLLGTLFYYLPVPLVHQFQGGGRGGSMRTPGGTCWAI